MDNKTETTRVIEIGKFYLVFDGSRTGHPGLVIWKDDNANLYLIIRTESDKEGKISKRVLERQHLIDLKHPTDISVIKSYVRSKPLMCKRKDIGKKELIGMSIHPDDLQIIETVSKRKPQYSKSFSKKYRKKAIDEPT